MAAGVTLTRAAPRPASAAPRQVEDVSDGFTSYVGSAGQSALLTILRSTPRGMPQAFNDGMLALSSAVHRLREAKNPTPEQGAQAVRQIREHSAAVRRAVERDRYAQQRGAAPVLRALDILDHSLSADQLKGYLSR